ncbi:MAG: lysoplasmalogenase, partial [Clostridia bacterium]|nr:lysoplasmalogenase [Clostridia bacterium]
MKKTIYILNALLFAVMITLDILLILDPSVLLKSLASACFVAAGIVNFAYALKLRAKPTFPALMLAGCVLAMAGDIVIYYPNDLCFMIGAGLFGAAHVLYVAAYFTLYSFHFTDAIAIFCIFLPSVLVITLAPIFEFGGVLMEIVCVVYAVILSLMVGKALANLRKKTALSVLIAIGSILFFTSDFMLLLNVFGKIGSVPRILCLATYYPAQFLLALSLIVFSERGMNLFKRLYCSTFQGALKLLLPFLPYKAPKLLQ